MHTDENELYFDDISHKACRDPETDFVGMHAFWIMDSICSMTRQFKTGFNRFH